MICCGLSLNVNWLWEEDQLTKQLQDIIQKFCRNFEGHRDGLPPLPGAPFVHIITPASGIVPIHATSSRSGIVPIHTIAPASGIVLVHAIALGIGTVPVHTTAPRSGTMPIHTVAPAMATGPILSATPQMANCPVLSAALIIATSPIHIIASTSANGIELLSSNQGGSGDDKVMEGSIADTTPPGEDGGLFDDPTIWSFFESQYETQLVFPSSAKLFSCQKREVDLCFVRLSFTVVKHVSLDLTFH